MIRLIAAVDSKNGIANEQGIPWSLPEDRDYYREKISIGDILMGGKVYDELKSPAGTGTNYVLTHRNELRQGFKKISDIKDVFQNYADIWVIGGAEIYKQALDFADEIYLTKIYSDFKCTKFFPSFGPEFKLISDSGRNNKGQLSYSFLIYKKDNIK